MRDIREIYESFIENDDEIASEDVKNSCHALHEAIDTCVCAIQEDMFRKAYNFGYVQGRMDAVENRVEVRND